MSSASLSANTLEFVAGRFRVLAEPSRLQLLDALRVGERSVSELVDATGLGQTNVSRHLQILLTAGLVRRRREGTHAMYSLADTSVLALCDLACGGIHSGLSERLAALTP